MAAGSLYIVATPLGNLGDMVPRAVDILQTVDVIAAEDTRHSRVLLDHFGIRTPMTAYHEHSTPARRADLLRQLQEGRSIALISDAGTPLISDPGYRLVQEARAAGITVSPVPGACALIAALSVSGLPCDRFVFEGFLPAKPMARRKQLQTLCAETRTLVFYESSHRIADCLVDLAAVLGGERQAVLARELTKLYETVHAASLADLTDWLLEDGNRQRGEFVLLVAGSPEAVSADVREGLRVAQILADSLPPSQAAELAARITGSERRAIYAELVRAS